MTAPARPSSFRVSARGQYGAGRVQSFSKNSDHETAARRWFAALLWRAFPAPSEHELSIKAAPVLGVTPRQVQNWLRCNNDASLKYVTAVALIAGVEIGIGRFGG